MIDRGIIVTSILIAIIGVPLSYLAMKIESKDINLPLRSWIRIFFTFVLASIIALVILKQNTVRLNYKHVHNTSCVRPFILKGVKSHFYLLSQQSYQES